MFDVVRIITSKQQILSVRSNPDPPIFKKIAVRSSPDPAKIGFSSNPVRSSPDPCSSLARIASTGVRLYERTLKVAIQKTKRETSYASKSQLNHAS